MLCQRVALGLAIFTGLGAARARAAEPPAYCSAANLATLADRPNIAWSACVTDLHTLVVESGYYQNASSVGSSEIAEYPNVEVAAGLVPHVELVFDAPTQVDRSLNNGHGSYTFSAPGIGMKMQVAAAADSAFSLGAEIHPPSTPTSYHGEPKYRIEAEQGRRLGKFEATLGLALVDDRRIIRRAESTPALRPSANLAFSATSTTSVALEVLDQASVARTLHAQAFDGIAIRRTLSRHVLFDIEGGQTINASANTRPHYIGAGLVVGPSR